MSLERSIANAESGSDRRAVRIVSKGFVTGAFLLHDAVLDADGKTLSVVGCKSGIVGRKTGDSILVLTGRAMIPAVITHIHAVHDRFRAALSAASLAGHQDVLKASLAPPRSSENGDRDVTVIDPI